MAKRKKDKPKDELAIYEKMFTLACWIFKYWEDFGHRFDQRF